MKSSKLIPRKSDVAFDKIRTEIITASFAPGTNVTESYLVRSFGFGKAAVRAALTRLCQEGLAQAVPHCGYRITPITIKDIFELFQLRAILEPAVSRLAVGKVNIKALRSQDLQWRQRCGAANEAVDHAALVANKEFHMMIARAAGNDRLTEMLGKVIDQSDRLIRLGLPVAVRREEIQQGHGPLIDALTKGSPTDAARAALKHVQTAKAIVMESVILKSNVLGAEIFLEN